MIYFKGGVRDGRSGEGCLSVFVLIALFSVRLSSVRLSSVPGVLPSTQAICVSHAQKNTRPDARPGMEIFER